MFHPALYIFSGAVCAIVFIFFDSSLLWVALLIALMAAPVYYGRKVFQAIRDMKWESRWLEEDFIA
ncbi:MAG: hypothetical protein WDO71_17050 [Bacteroidota bacterium]